jgi:sulfonate transport system permease protein
MSDAQQATGALALDRGRIGPWSWRQVRIFSWRAVVGVAILAAWQGAAEVTGKLFIAGPLDVLERIVELAGTGELWVHSYVTFEEALIGYGLGAGAAIALPFALRRSPRLMTALDPYMAASMAVPKLALAPLIILWFGIGLLSKILFVASLVFFLIFFNVLAGVLAADPKLLAMARVAGANEWVLAREVVWNSAMPYLLTGLKISLPRGISAAVVGEFLAADAGLGYYIEYSRDQADTIGIFTGIVVVTIYVLVLNTFLKRMQIRALAWRPVDREMSG